jgi:hypothetical protein
MKNYCCRNTMPKEEIVRIFREEESKGLVHKYVKSGSFLCRKAVQNEMIVTKCSGIIETIFTIKRESDSIEEYNKYMVIKNITVGSSGETYVIKRSKFEERYTYNDCDGDIRYVSLENHLWREVTPIGEVEATIWDRCLAHFDAPWGEKMMIMEGDMLCRCNGDNNDIYRIAKNEFDITYTLMEENKNEQN